MRSVCSVPSAPPASRPAPWLPHRPGSGAGAACTVRAEATAARRASWRALDLADAYLPIQARRTPCRAGAAAGAGLVAQDPAPGRLARVRDPPHQSRPCRSGSPASLARTCPRDEVRGRWPWPGRSLSPRVGSGPSPGHGPLARDDRGLVPGRPSQDLSAGEATTSVPLPRPTSLPPPKCGRARCLAMAGRPACPRPSKPGARPAFPGPFRETRREVDGPGLLKFVLPGGDPSLRPVLALARDNRGLLPGRPSPDRSAGRGARSMSPAQPKSLSPGGVRASARSWLARPRQTRPGATPSFPRTGPRDEARGRWSWPGRSLSPRAGSGPSPGQGPHARDTRGLVPSHPSPGPSVPRFWRPRLPAGQERPAPRHGGAPAGAGP